jgi:uncharacterized protein
MSALADMPHLPYPAPIDAYGNGGFRFADMSHRGSILCLPDGIWAWPYRTVAELDATALAAIVERHATIDFFMLGTGRDPMTMPAHMRALLADAGVNADAMTTGAAVRTYNIMLGENRRVAAGLIAVP